MKLKFINHAGFCISQGSTTLACDPWFSGAVFNNGWSLLVETPFDINAQVFSHVWISHEHPDHFNPPNLEEIKDKSGVEVLFQESQDGRVLGHCRKLGFKVRELANKKPINLGGGVEILVGAYKSIDSWLLIKAGGKRLLNLNDCFIDRPKELAEIEGLTGPVDAIFYQFSYASGFTNPDQVERRRDMADATLTQIKNAVDFFKPRFVVPFASFFYHSNQDNFYLNDSINTIGFVERELRNRTGSTPVILYPGDEWDLESALDNARPLALYDAAYRRLENRELPINPIGGCAIEDIRSAAQAYVARIRSRNRYFALWHARLKNKRIRFRIEDLRESVVFDFRHGIREDDARASMAEVTLNSEPLRYLFEFDWGADTLTVNGRFKADAEGLAAIFEMFYLGHLYRIGRRLDTRHYLNRVSETLFQSDNKANVRRKIF